MRMQIVKGTADNIKKKAYLEQRERVAQKERLMEDAKKQIDAEFEKRRNDLAAKAVTSKMGDIKEF